MSDYYPAVAFRFQVRFGGSMKDTSFQEVSGLSTQLDVESVTEGGNNHFVWQLPKGVKNQNLELKRGLVTKSSELYQWCKQTIDSGLESEIVTKHILVTLINAYSIPIYGWIFKDAYPLKWDIEALNSTKNDVAIEKIILCYTSMFRFKL